MDRRALRRQAFRAARDARADSPCARRAIGAAIAAVFGVAPATGVGNTITPDGRTATQVTLRSGDTAAGTAVQDITTGTVRGDNAFNSFRDFRITPGNTVNLRLPDGTDNLINLVTDSRAVIDGTLNGVKGGRIGGNVVFADPHGIVVGASGVINVGGLMLTAPTQTFMDTMMSVDADGATVIDEAAVQQLLMGEAPLSAAPDAVVEVNGTVNAYGAVALEGGGVMLTQTGDIQAGTDAAHEALFQEAVNTDGITEAADAAVIDGRVTIRAAGDTTVAGVADASSAGPVGPDGATRPSGLSAGRIDITAGGAVSVTDTARLAAVGAVDGGDGGRIDIAAGTNLDAAGDLNASATQDTSAGGQGDGGDITLDAAQDLDLAGTARLSAAGAASGGDAGTIDIEADGTATVDAATAFDVSAGSTGDGGLIEISGAGNLSLAGLSADLSGGAGGTDGEFLIGTVNVSVTGTEYYTNGGDVTINAGDSLTIGADTTINTRRIDSSVGAVTITPASTLGDNPAGLADPLAADSYTTASEGDSGNVTLQAPHITVAGGARIYTFATDGYDAGDISLVSGDNFTCNICEARDPGDYFSSVENVGNTFRVASTDDVNITVENGATLDARYVERTGYDGLNGVGTGGDVALSADASDMQVAGWSMADASVTVNGALRGANVSVTATAKAGVDFAWLAAAFDPMNPAGPFIALQEIAGTDFDSIHQNAIENADDPSDLTNLLGLGLPVTAGLAMADATVDVGAGAELAATGNLLVKAEAGRTVLGDTGGYLDQMLPAFGVGVMYGQVSGITSAVVSGDASLTGAAVDVIAESANRMEAGASAQVEQTKSVTTKGNKSVAFALAIGRADVTTEARVGANVSVQAPAGGSSDVTVRASNLDDFSTDGSTLAIAPPTGSNATSQGAMTVSFSEWRTDALASFDASVASTDGLANLDVVADNLSVTRATRATVQNGNNVLDYLVGATRDRRRALNALIGGAYRRSGSAASFRLSAGAAITISEQTAVARIGGGADIDATGDVTVRSRVVDQGIRNVADSRVNSSAGPDGAKVSGSVAVAFGKYDHSSRAVIGDGVDITAAHIGVGALSELPIDNDYDEALADFDVTQWDGPADFFGALGTLITAVRAPDAVTVESLGLADYLLTSYSNAYGIAEETAVFGSANALITSQDTRAWVGEGATLRATGADGEWTSEFGFAIEPDPGDDPHDLDTATQWTWSAAADVDARTRNETVGVTGNLSLLTLASNRMDPAGSSVGGSFAWTEFDNTTIAGIGDGAVVTAASLDVDATTDEIMYVIAPSAGVGESTAGNGIFSLAQMDGTTHASVHSGARIDAGTVGITAEHDVNLWAIGGAVAVSSETSIGAAVAANDVVTDTRAYIGDNSADRVLDQGEDPDAPVADVAVASGEAAGVLTGALTVDANSEGRVGAIGVAGAVARSEPTTPSSPSAPPARPAPSTPTNNSFLGALQSAGSALGGGGSTPGGQSATLSGAGSGTLNFSRVSTVAEVRDTSLLNDATDAAPNVTVRALTNVDQVSASGSAAVSISGGGGGRSSAFAGAVAFNDIDNETRAGIYGFGAPNGGRVGDVDVLAATSGDALSIGIALAATSGQSSVGASGSVSIADIGSDTTAEIEDSEFTADAADDSVEVTGYDRSRALAGGGALYLGLGGGSGAGVGLAATYGRIDNDVTAYIRGSTLTDFNTLDVSALGASRILAGAFGGSVSTGNSASGAGSLYIMTLNGDLSAGITGSYGTVDDDGDPATPEVTDYTDVQRRSDVDTSGDVNVRAASSAGVATIDGLFSAGGGFDSQADFGGGALDAVDPDQTGIDPNGGVPGEAVLGFAGSLAISGGNAAAGMAIGFTDLQGGYTAEIRDADVTATAGDVNVKAVNSRQAIGVAAGASVSGSGGPFTLLGSGAITLSDATVNARVLGASNITADHVDIAAAAEGTVYSLAGSLSVSASGSAALGAAATYNDIGGNVTARLGGTSVVTDGADPADAERTVDVTADQDADIYSAAISGSAGGGSVAASGSATINTITTQTQARIDADAVTADTVRVQARNGVPTDRVSVWSLAGSITASNNAAFGAAFAFNTLDGGFESHVDGTTFTDTDELTVSSSGDAQVKTLAVSGGASGNIAAGISDASSSVSNKVGAYVDDATLQNDAARVTIDAADRSRIDSLAGAVQVGGTSAVGAAAAVNGIGNTVEASLTGGRFDVENLTVDATSSAEIGTIAVGVAVSGTNGLAGSIAVNLLDTNTSANIDGGADVTAQHNVGVTAKSDDAVDVVAGAVGVGVGAVGGGLSVVVNHITGDTTAGISGSTTSVDALALDSGDVLTVADGDLASVPDVTKLEEAADYTPVDLTASQRDVTGVAVNAQSMQSVGTFATTVGISASLGSVSGALTANTNIIGGRTAAFVEEATVNAETGADARQDADVRASSHAWTSNMTLGLAVGGGVSATGTLGADAITRTTEAYLSGAQVNAEDAVAVCARTRLGTSLLAAGGAAGPVGAAGGASFALHDATTLAYLDGGTDVTAGRLSVDAEADNDILLAAGALAVGGTAAAGAIDLGISSLTTEATVDGAYRDTSSGSGDTSVIDVDGNVSVTADSDTSIEDYAVGGAGGGGSGLAGSMAVNVVENGTVARMSGADVGSDSASGNVTVTASDRARLFSVAGAVGIGIQGTGLGAGVHVSVIHSTVNSLVQNTTVETTGSMTVDANSTADVEAVGLAAGVGGTAGISGGISVSVIGSGERGDAAQEIGDPNSGTLGAASSIASRERTGSAVNGQLTTDQQAGLSGVGQYDLAAATDESLADTTTARISGGSITASSVSVTADDSTRLKSLAGAFAAGSVGVGGAFVVDRVFNTVDAGIIGDATVITPGNVTVRSRAFGPDDPLTASDGRAAVDSEAYAGAAGMVGVGAAVVDARIDNQVDATVTATLQDTSSGTGTGVAGNALKVSAEDTTEVSVKALGAAAGAAAAGVVVANAGKDSVVDARIIGASLSQARDTSVTALSRGAITAESTAAAGGLLGAVSGSVATAVDVSDVDAGVHGSTLEVEGAGLRIEADAVPQTSSDAFGVAVGGYLSVGASVATAKADSTVDAEIGSGSTVSGDGGVRVLADAAPVDADTDTARAAATGASGAGLLGANATVTDAFSDTHVTATVASGATVDVDGAVTVAAGNRTRQESDADSYSVGLIAVGANVATAKSTGSTTASFNGTIAALEGGEARQDLSVRAIGNAENTARSEAGNGGVIAGAASNATTRDNSTVTATLANSGTAEVANLDVAALHTSDFLTKVNSTQASIVGMSGAWSDSEVDVGVTAVVGAGAVVRADNIGILASGVATHDDDGYAVVSGSGGAFNAAAAEALTDVTFTTGVEFNAGADLRVTGDWLDPGLFTVLAENDLDLRDAVKLDAGGAIAIARATARTTVNSTTSVNVGDARLQTVGDLVLAARTNADVTAKTDAKTYGAAGAAQGRSSADVTATPTIDVAAGAELEGWGDVELLAGQDTAGAAGTFNLTSRTDLWNKTAFPVETDPNANTTLTQTGSIDIASGASVRSVGDVFLEIDPGFRNLTGRGIGKDLYRAAAEEIANGIGSLVGAEEVSLDITAGSTTDNSSGAVTVNGTVEAGIFHDQYLTLELPAGFDPNTDDFETVLRNNATSSEGVSFDVYDDSYSQNLFARLDRLYAALRDFNGSAVERAAFEVEINFIERQLEELGRSIGLTDAEMFPNGRDGGIILPNAFPITVVSVDDILARPGNIQVRANTLTGTGVLDAPGDASIRIENRTPAFLELGRMEIPEEAGGRILFNRSSVTNAAEISAINTAGVPSGFDDANIRSAADSGAPIISVTTEYTTTDYPGTPKPLSPDIEVLGDVFNRRGEVIISTNEGSVYVDGDVRANRTEIGAGENVVLGYIDSFRHIGRDPAGIGEPPARGATIAGNSIIISARYINVNGLIQSGIPQWSVDLDGAASTEMSDARIDYYYNGGPAIVRVAHTDPVTGTIGYRYDVENDRVLLDPVEVAGGYMELTGKIMSTGNGELRVLDGYGRVTVNNTTGADIEIAGIDLGNEVEGRIRINDAGLLNGNNENLTSTIYTRVGDSVQVYRGAFTEVAETAAYLDETLTAAASDRSTTYAPREGLDYLWVAGTSAEYKEVRTYYSDTAIGFIPSGDGTLYDSYTQDIGDPIAIDATEYLTENLLPDGMPAADSAYVLENGVYVADDLGFEVDPASPYTSTRHWTTCETWFLACVETRTWKEVTQTYGAVTFDRRGVHADRAIDIRFSGSDAGSVSVLSNSNIYVAGSVSNASGTTTLNGTRVHQTDSEALIRARDLNLTADYGIGRNSPLQVVVSGALDASTTYGDVRINAEQGDLNIVNGSSTSGYGDVMLSAQGSILSAGSGVIRGDAVTLEARQGAVGQPGAAVRIDTGNRATSIFNASGPQGVHVVETAGDLRVDQIDAGISDLSLTVNDGALLDANTTEAVDERLDAEIQALWADMDLTGAEADEALAREIASQERAGQTRYERYWQLRETTVQTDEDGNITGYTSQAYDPGYTATFTSSQIDALTQAYGWEASDVDARIADLEARRTAEYHALHDEFGTTGGYDPTFDFALTEAERDALGAGHAWTTDQLIYSVSAGLAGAPGANTGVIDEVSNLIGGNITINAAEIGRTLDETLVIDLSDGVRALTDGERRALGTAEYDDVAIDPDSPQIITIVQRDDVDITAQGHITAQATGNAFIGGEQDLNLYDVSGQAVRIKTDGSVTTARAGETVLSGTDVILEGSNGDIGSLSARLGTAITGELTARTTGGVYLDQTGDLTVNRMFGQNGIDLLVDGSLFAARSLGETLTGGAVNLEVRSDIGTSANRVDVALGLNESLSIVAGGDAYLGGERGLVPAPAALTLGATTVNGRLDVADVTDLVMQDVMTVGGLTLDLSGNWTIEETGSLVSSGVVDATVAGDAGLRSVGVTDASDDAFVLGANTITALGDGNHLDVVGGIDLDTDGDIAAASAPLHVGAARVDATSLNGDVYIDFFRAPDQGGDIAAISGETILGGVGASLDSLFGADRVVADFSGDLTVAGTTASDGAVTLDAENITLATLESAGHATLDARRDISVDSGTVSAGDLTLSAGNDAVATVLNVSGDAVVNATGRADLGTVTGANIDVDAGEAAIDAGTADSTISVTTTLNPLFDGGTSTGDQDHGVLRAGDLVELIAAGTIRFDQLHAGRPGDPEGTNGDVLIESGEDVFGNLIDANRDIGIDAVGSLSVDEASSGGVLDLNAGRNVLIGVGGDITQTSITAGNNVELYARGTEPGTNGDILLQALDAGGHVIMDAAGDIRILPENGTSGFIDAGSYVDLTADGDIEVPRITADGDVTATGTLLDFGTVTSGADVTLDALDDIRVVSVDSAGFQDHQARGDFRFETLDAGGTLTSVSGGTTTGDTARADGPLTMTAGAEWSESGVFTGSVGENGDLLLQRVEAPEVRLRSAGRTEANEVIATDIATFQGETITSRVTDGDDGTLFMSFAGGNGGLADTVRLLVDTGGEIVFNPAYARDAEVQTTGDHIRIDDGWISEWMVLRTSTADLLMDQLDPTARPWDFQLLELDERFRLLLEGRTLWTDAYISHYAPGYSNDVPNFQSDHATMGLLVGGESAERNVTRSMEDGREPPRLGGGSSFGPAPTPVESPMDVPLDGAPVNTDEDGQASREGDGAEGGLDV